MSTRRRIATLERLSPPPPRPPATAAEMHPRALLSMLLCDPEGSRIAAELADLLLREETLSDAERAEMNDQQAAMMAYAEVLKRKRDEAERQRETGVLGSRACRRG